MRSRRLTAALALAVCALLAGPATAAKLYKWVDEDGNVTYSQVKPPDRKVEELELRGYQAAEPALARDRLEQRLEEDAAKRKDQEFAAGEAEARKQREQRMKKNCEIARQNLRILQSAPRVRDKNTEGKPYFLGPDQIEQRIEQTQRQIDDYCG